MASRLTATLLLLGVVCIGFAAAEVAVDCCLTTTPKRVPFQIVADYRIQEAGKGCDIAATVIITKNERILCVSHHTVETWVQKLIKHLGRRGQQA